MNAPAAASALESPDQLYRLIAETIPHMVWTTRADGEADYFNGRMLQYAGMSEAEMKGWGWKEYVHPEDRERCLALWGAALRSGERYRAEVRLRRADGAFRWHVAAGLPMRDAQGRILGWFGTCTDVEDDRRSSEALRARVEETTRALAAGQMQLRAIIDNQPECVKLLDAEGRLIDMNPAGLRMVEAESLAPVLGRDVCELIVPESQEAFRALTRRVCAGERGTLEFEIVGLRGARRWLETHAVPLRDEARGATLLLGITRDITERKHAERALRESERRFESFMHNVPASAWIKDSRLRYSWVNPEYQRRRGPSAGSVIGRDDFEVQRPEVAMRRRKQDEEVLLVGAAVQYVNAAGDSETPGTYNLVVKFPMLDANGGLGVAGIAVDITERHQLERTVRQLLNRMVRTQEGERHKIAGDLHDLIGQKLTALNLNLDIVRQSLAPATRAPLEDRLGHMSALLEETIAAIRDVMAELRPPALEEHGLTAALFQYASVFEARTGLRVKVSGPGHSLTLSKEIALALFRIAQEALTNAAKHSGASHVRVTVKKDPAQVSMRIEDDGRGLPAKSLRRGPNHDGGWGLPEMRERAEAVGGWLEVQSSEGGTGIIVDVPLPGADQRHPG